MAMGKFSIQQITEEQANEFGVSSADYAVLTKVLGKTPDLTALMLYSLIWTDELTENDVDMLEAALSSNGEIGKFIHLGKGKVFYAKAIKEKSKASFTINDQVALAVVRAGLNHKDWLTAFLKENQPENGKIDLNRTQESDPFQAFFVFGSGHVPENEINKVIADAGTTRPYSLLEEARYEQQTSIESVPYPDTLKEVSLAILSSPKIADSNYLFAKGKAPLKLEESPLLLALSANSNYRSSDGSHEVSVLLADAARNLACRGAYPIAINCALQFNDENGNTDAEYIVGVTEGIKKFGEVFNLPVTSALIDFKANESRPTTAFGLAGVKGKKSLAPGFKNKGDLIFIVGKTKEDIDGSVYLSEFHNKETDSAPYFDFKSELVTHNVVRSLIDKELISAAESCSVGGLFMALTKMALPQELGFDIVTDAEIREDAYLFGESAGRVVVSVNEEVEDEFIEFMMQSGVSYTLLGHVTQGKMMVDDEHFGFIQGAKEIYNQAVHKSLTK